MLTIEQLTPEELQHIKDVIWELLGFHPDTDPDIIYDRILELRSYARQVK